MAFACPICDDALTWPAPNYQAETVRAVRAREAVGDSVIIVAEVPGRGSRARARGAGHKKKMEKPPGRSTVVSTPCGHLFHVACLEEWFKNTNNVRTCPSCRKPCPSSKMVPIFPVIVDHNYRGADDQPSTSAAALSGSRGFNAGFTMVDVPDPAPAQNPNTSAEDLHQIYNMFMQDYEDLQGRYTEELNKVARSQAITNNLQSMCDELKNENEALKKEDETRKKEVENLKKEVDALKKALEAQSQPQTGNSGAAGIQAVAPAATAPGTSTRRGKGKETVGAGVGGNATRGRVARARAGMSKAEPRTRRRLIRRHRNEFATRASVTHPISRELGLSST